MRTAFGLLKEGARNPRTIVADMDSTNGDKLKAFYVQYRAWLIALLEEQDPVGIVFPDAFTATEYDMEASLMATLVPRARSSEELAEKIHRVFVESFDAQMAGGPSDYLVIARAMIDKWQQMRSQLGLEA